MSALVFQGCCLQISLRREQLPHLPKEWQLWFTVKYVLLGQIISTEKMQVASSKRAFLPVLICYCLSRHTIILIPLCSLNMLIIYLKSEVWKKFHSEWGALKIWKDLICKPFSCSALSVIHLIFKLLRGPVHLDFCPFGKQRISFICSSTEMILKFLLQVCFLWLILTSVGSLCIKWLNQTSHTLASLMMPTLI